MSDGNDIVMVDARGLACPEPVMLAKSALTRVNEKVVEVSVDTGTSRDNLVRLARREGRDAEVVVDGDGFIVRIGAKKA